jgi:hypothetical protein
MISWPNAVVNQSTNGATSSPPSSTILSWSYLPSASVQSPTARRFFVGIQSEAERDKMMVQGAALAQSDLLTSTLDLMGGDSLELDTALVVSDLCNAQVAAAQAQTFSTRTSSWYAPVAVIGGQCSTASGKDFS